MSSEVESFYPLAPMQQGILFHTLYAPQTTAYFQQLDCVLRGTLDVAAFAQAWRRVAERHAALRTAFVWEEIKEPIQVVHLRAEIPLEVLDAANATEAEQSEWWEELLRAERARSFDLSSPPLLRLLLARVGDDCYRFSLSYHHIILDGWSVPLLLREVFAFHKALAHGRELTVAEPPRFRDYIVWLRRQDLPAAENFWRRHLKGFNAPTAVGRRLAPASVQAEAEFAEERVDLSSSTAHALQALARSQRLTPSTLFYGAWALLLHHYTGEGDLLFGVTVSGRMAELPGVETMVGLLVNTLPLRVRVKTDTVLLDWLKQLQLEQNEARQYEYTPLFEIQKWSELPGGQPLFESIVVFENYPVAEGMQEALGGLSVERVRTFERTNYPLTLLVGSRPASSLRLIYDTRSFTSDLIGRMLSHLKRMLEEFAREPARKLSALSMLTEAEQFQLLVEWNDTETVYQGEPCIHHLFTAQAARTPDAVAVVDGETHLTYRELEARALRVAHRLRELGAQPETTVGVCLTRSSKMLVGLLGVLMSGSAYVPLDPEYPRQRFSFMLTDSRALLLLTETALASLAETACVPVVNIDSLDETTGEIAARAVLAGDAGGENLAYVIYTSGSTGLPKGTAIEHRQVVTFLRWADEAFTSPQKEKVFASTSICFDLSIFELFLPLVCGGTVVMAQNGLALHASSAAHSVTLLNTVPSVLTELLKLGALPSSVQTVNLAGEPLKSQLVRQAYEQCGVGEIYNLYGPSEDTTYTTYALLEKESDDAPPIGRPIANTQVHLLDRAGSLVPIGVTGQIYIGGGGLARGYLHRPELTAERFTPNHLSLMPGSRLYQTGDLARLRPDGQLEFLGRADYQVKLRGFRIELGEIEIALCRHEAVQEAAVVVRESRSGEKLLAAYVACRPDGEVTGEKLRDFLGEKLPAYMLPYTIMLLERLPLTPNGKVDRRALPEPDADAAGKSASYVAPRSQIERRIIEVWQEVLRLPKVGIHDNFFDLGGHSLLLLAAYARLRNSLGRELSMVELFKHPTVAALAAFVSRGTEETAPLKPDYEQAQSRRDSLKRMKNLRNRQRTAGEAEG